MQWNPASTITHWIGGASGAGVVALVDITLVFLKV